MQHSNPSPHIVPIFQPDLCNVGRPDIPITNVSDKNKMMPYLTYRKHRVILQEYKSRVRSTEQTCNDIWRFSDMVILMAMWLAYENTMR